MNVEVFCFDAVAPVRERGLKFFSLQPFGINDSSRSREGAWIEIQRASQEFMMNVVAPVRERGLKCSK